MLQHNYMTKKKLENNVMPFSSESFFSATHQIHSLLMYKKNLAYYLRKMGGSSLLPNTLFQRYPVISKLFSRILQFCSIMNKLACN